MVLVAPSSSRIIGLFLILLVSLPVMVVKSLSSSSVPVRSKSKKTKNRPRIAVVGGGISGLTVAHVLQQSGRYSVLLFEEQPQVGGHVRSKPDPTTTTTTSTTDSNHHHHHHLLNIGHATHMGMFVNMRLLLKHLGVKEWPVGRGPNEQPGLFRTLSVTADKGQVFQPPRAHIASIQCWWEALVFYFDSYRQPELRLDSYLSEKTFFSKRFVDIVYWAMATFEFDKHKQEAGEYALGAARALLITQVFFQYLLCDSFQGNLPARIDQGLARDLATRIANKVPYISQQRKADLLKCFEQVTSDSSLASYFTTDYGAAMRRLKAGAGQVFTSRSVVGVSKSDKNGLNVLETANGDRVEADAVVFTTHPSIIARCLNKADYPRHQTALAGIESGAVGVRIVHAKDLPFTYPPPSNMDKCFGMDNPPPILGVFDISELTTLSSDDEQAKRPVRENHAGWLSVAYPVYHNATMNRHQECLQKIPCLDETVYPWTRATALFPKFRREIVGLQGSENGIYVTGASLSGVNKASELQITNALNLCKEHFGVDPPWKLFFPCPMLPDCNDEDAFFEAKSLLQAAFLSVKSLVGSFLLASVVDQLGVDILR